MARIVGQATSGLAPKYVLMTPVEAIKRLVAKIGWSLDDVDLFEINEAFSVQIVAILGELGIDATRVNVNGGAVALGHPIGASGARILTTLLYALQQSRAPSRHRSALSWRRQWRGSRRRETLSQLPTANSQRCPAAIRWESGVGNSRLTKPHYRSVFCRAVCALPSPRGESP